MRAGIVVNVTRADRYRLEAIALRRSSTCGAPNIILATADRCGTAEIMRRSGKSKPVVWRWQVRFMAESVEGLTQDKTRTRGKRSLSTDSVEKVVDLALRATGRRTRWTSNTGESGGSEPAIGATYLRGPPTRAASHPHVQAVDGPRCFQLSTSSMAPSSAATCRTSLPRFIRLLSTIEEQVPKARQWLARHPLWTFHFTPTSASWPNAVEGFFAKLTRQRLKRGVFRCVIDLQVAINRFVAETNLSPKALVLTADPKRVLAAVKWRRQTLESVHETSTKETASSSA
jgi:hypothetical protein